MARSRKKHYNQRSIKAGRKTAKLIKSNVEVLRKFK